MPAVPAPLPENENARLLALKQYEVLDTEHEQAFDDLTRLAAQICGTPISLVSLIDTSRQWFKSRVGLDAAETPRDLAFCAHAILQDGIFIVPDATKDPRFAANPLVTAAPDIRFYAGMPLITPDNFAIGTLCVIDRVPHDMTDGQREALKTLSHQVIAQLELRLHLARLAKTNAALSDLAATDGLTGLKNHRAFQEYWEEQFSDAQRGNSAVSLIMVDVDHFKNYNDTFGHPAGDEALKTVANLLRETARASDIVARYGGEEFVIALPDTSGEEAANAAERLRGAIAAHAWDKRAVTVSLGVASYRPGMLDASVPVAQADQALYRAKQSGRNQVSVFADDTEQTAVPARINFPSLRMIPGSDDMMNAVYDATIEGWSRILDLRDKETEGHSERVTLTTLRLAREIGMNAEEQMYIRWGSLLHDIGKMGIPDNILLKPGKLTEEEWVIMKQHPTYAFEMLSPITFLQPALDIPYCHHEKWDGSGYPRGLQGDTIPLAARLFAVVDVWDALRSDRPYRKGWAEDRVLDYLREQSGTHFDPRIVDIFMNVISHHHARKAA